MSHRHAVHKLINSATYLTYYVCFVQKIAPLFAARLSVITKRFSILLFSVLKENKKIQQKIGLTVNLICYGN